MMMIALLAATVLMANSTALQAAPSEAPPAPAAGASNTVSPVIISREAADAKRKAQDPNRLVCRTEPVLGSRMGVKKCATVGELAMQKFEAQQDLAKIQARDGNHP